MRWLDSLKKRWQIKSKGQVLIILLVFACTGTTAVYVKKPLSYWLGLDLYFSGGFKAIIQFFLVLFVYQFLLLGYGFLFGQFRFFWEFEKRMFARIAKIFR